MKSKKYNISFCHLFIKANPGGMFNKSIFTLCNA